LTTVIEITYNATREWTTDNALIDHLEGISSQGASPNSENENTIADFLRVPGDIRGNVGFQT
jgi:hypothetical protein